MKTLKINEFGQKTSFQKEKRGTQTKIHTSGDDSLFFPMSLPNHMQRLMQNLGLFGVTLHLCRGNI